MMLFFDSIAKWSLYWLPADIFFSQVMDVNYLAGLTWTRQPGVRVVFHPTDQVAIGFSAENPNQYMGGSSGGSRLSCRRR